MKKIISIVWGYVCTNCKKKGVLNVWFRTGDKMEKTDDEGLKICYLLFFLLFQRLLSFDCFCFFTFQRLLSFDCLFFYFSEITEL